MDLTALEGPILESNALEGGGRVREHLEAEGIELDVNEENAEELRKYARKSWPRQWGKHAIRSGR